MKRWSLDARSEGRVAYPPGEGEELKGARSMRAVKGSLGPSPPIDV